MPTPQQINEVLARAIDEINQARAGVDSLPVIPPARGIDYNRFDPEKRITTLAYKPGMRITNGYVDLRVGSPTKDVYMDNVIVTGGPTVPSRSPMPMVQTSEGWHLERVVIEPMKRSVMWSDGIRLRPRSWAERCTAQGTVDGFSVYTPSGRTECGLISCMVRDLFWSATDPNHADGTHNDGLQLHGLVAGLKIDDFVTHLPTTATASIMANVSSIEDMQITRSILQGGKSGLNLSKVTSVKNSSWTDSVVDSVYDYFATLDAMMGFRVERVTDAAGNAAIRTKP